MERANIALSSVSNAARKRAKSRPAGRLTSSATRTPETTKKSSSTVPTARGENSARLTLGLGAQRPAKAREVRQHVQTSREVESTVPRWNPRFRAGVRPEIPPPCSSVHADRPGSTVLCTPDAEIQVEFEARGILTQGPSEASVHCLRTGAGDDELRRSQRLDQVVDQGWVAYFDFHLPQLPPGVAALRVVLSLSSDAVSRQGVRQPSLQAFGQ